MGTNRANSGGIRIVANRGPSGVCSSRSRAGRWGDAGANVADTRLLAETIEAVVLERPKPTPKHPQNLCLDKGYDNPTGHKTAAAYHYTPH